MGVMQAAERIRWLEETREDALEALWREADRVRARAVGDEVHLRGLIEISNFCPRDCHYCGLRRSNSALTRYRMTAEEILGCARDGLRFGYGTVVLQAGEDPRLDRDWVAALVERIKAETGLAITLSLGERPSEDLALWRAAGADRYLLRFETSNRELFARIHPPRSHEPIDRIAQLGELRRLGYEVGSGVMVGIPGQTFADLAQDLALFEALDLDMIGIGPFIPHPGTPLGEDALRTRGPASPEPPLDPSQADLELMTYKMVALARIARPDANIPSTTALATLNLSLGRELGLQRGANVVMPNLTPTRYRILYEIYPAKACIQESADQCHSCLRRRIESIGRQVGQGPGLAPSMLRRGANG